ncbi:MAG: SusC/RagA family TonB-linked outer membrane protein, partial [Phocaeicola plebeius]|nr:SusC/RagA family TonB-linked outer membrane protein [Phocaeicola plebeius]
GYDKWTTAGFFGRLNYDYKGRYLFEANIRYDGSSRFLRDNRWNWFPSFSAGWNIAQEKFWEDWNMTEKINTLKLRASWGELGNQNTDNWYPFYPTVGFSQQGGGWLVNGNKPNTASEPALVSALLTWERSRTWEVGLDWGALNNRLTGSFGYFQRKTYDMVGPAQDLPDVLGASEPKVNNLDMTSKGWDLQVSWRDQINDFRYGVSLTLSDNTVTIDKYPNDSKELSKYYAGAKLGDIWGYTTIGIANSQEEMDAHLAKADQSRFGSNWTAGDIMYADLNGDGVVNNGEYRLDDHGDLSIIGNSTPRYNFGLNLDAAWKGFDLKLFFQGTLKRDYWAGGSVFWGAIGQGKWQSLGFKQHEDYWTPENTNAYYPRADWSGGRNTYTQTRYLQNAAYCRLKNITLGYTLPQEITRKFYVENLRLFVSGENLLTITGFTDLSDPELVGVGQWGFGKTYPLSKTVSLGLSVTF